MSLIGNSKTKMAYRLRRTHLADTDYKDILRETKRKWGIDQRTKYRGMLRDAITTIGKDPFIITSKARDDLHDGARLYPVGKHYLLYWISDQTVILERILHQGMDLSRHLGDLGK